MKKITASFLVCLLFFGPLARPSHSLVMVPPMVAVGGLVLAAIAGYTVYNYGSFTMDGLGRAVTNVAISITNDLMVKGKLLTAAADIYSTVMSSPLTFPALYSATKEADGPYSGSGFPSPGDTVIINGVSYSYGALTYGGTSNMCVKPNDSSNTSALIIWTQMSDYPTGTCVNGGNAKWLANRFPATLTSVYNPSSLPKFTENLTELPTSPSAIRSEMDAAIVSAFKNRFGGGSTPVLAEVPDVIVDADRDGPLTGQILHGLKDRAIAVEASKDYERLAVTSATAAAAVAVTAAGASAASPADQTLATAAASAAAASAGAALTAAGAAASSAAAIKSLGDSVAAGAAVTTKAETAAVHSGAPVKKLLDWSKFNALKTVLMTKFPFTLVAGLTAQFALLNSGSGVAPAFNLPLPLGNSIRVDLAIFNPIAIVIRYLLGVAVTIGLTLYIVRFWRGN